MKITIMVTREDNFDVIERNYQGDYDKLYNEDWNDKLRDMLNALNDNN